MNTDTSIPNKILAKHIQWQNKIIITVQHYQGGEYEYTSTLTQIDVT